MHNIRKYLEKGICMRIREIHEGVLVTVCGSRGEPLNVDGDEMEAAET